jgi:hypothetical protein
MTRIARFGFSHQKKSSCDCEWIQLFQRAFEGSSLRGGRILRTAKEGHPRISRETRGSDRKYWKADVMI